MLSNTWNKLLKYNQGSVPYERFPLKKGKYVVLSLQTLKKLERSPDEKLIYPFIENSHASFRLIILCKLKED